MEAYVLRTKDYESNRAQNSTNEEANVRAIALMGQVSKVSEQLHKFEAEFKSKMQLLANLIERLEGKA